MRGLAGMKIGVAPHLPGRLRALLATEGLDADKDIEQTVLLGKLQNPAFHDKKVDALFAHTPYLEKAIVEDDAVVLIDPARGEVKGLATRLVHAFAFTRAAHDTRRPAVMAAVRAIAAAQKSIHASPESAVDALAREHPSRSRKELEALVRIYEPAIPEIPDVQIEDLAPALALLPEGVDRPALAGIELKPFVASDLAPKVREDEGGRRTQWIVGAVVLIALVGGAIALRGRKSRTSS
jgi:ABC-type nitrate/sulfonate/bicarbonate transport system substrate-binding protein